MCNRFASEKSRDQIAKEYQTVGELPQWQASADIRPTASAPIIALGKDRTRRLLTARWGLVDNKTGKMIKNTMNARSERLLELPTWRSMFLPYQRDNGPVIPPRRCLIPFSGFYEYTGDKPPLQPWTIKVQSNRVYAMAGLFRSFQPPMTGAEPGARIPDGFVRPAPAVCFTMLMCDPGLDHGVMGTIHDRMPVILEEDDFPAWLGETEAATDDLLAMMKPYPAEKMEAVRGAPFSKAQTAH